MAVSKPVVHGIAAPQEWQADPKNVKRVMIVAASEYFVFEHRDPRGVPLRIIERDELPYECDAYELAGLAFANRCGAVWLVDGDYDLLAFDADDTTYTFHELSSKGAVAGLVAQKRGPDGKGQGLPLCIYGPDIWGVADRVPAPYTVDNATRARALAEGVALAAVALGQQLRFSPSYTGNQIMRRVLADYERRTGKTIPQPSQEMRDFCYTHRPTPVQWRTDMPIYDASCDSGEDITVHIYDRNMSYVSSAREVPVGDPLPTQEFHPGCAGLYHVAEAWEDSYSTPIDGADCWLWEPELRKTMKENPDSVRIIEGYYWPKTSKLDLRLWHDRIWAARRACHAVEGVAGRIAESIVKKAGVSTIGRLIQRRGRKVVREAEAVRDGLRILNYESDDSGELTGNVEVIAPLGREDMAWPHVWGTVISNANERLWNVIATYAPHITIAAYIDQIYTLQRSPELDAMCDPMKTGGWKYSGSFRVPVADLEELNTMGAQALVKRFAAYQRQQAQEVIELPTVFGEGDTDDGE